MPAWKAKPQLRRRVVRIRRVGGGRPHIDRVGSDVLVHRVGVRLPPVVHALPSCLRRTGRPEPWPRANAAHELLRRRDEAVRSKLTIAVDAKTTVVTNSSAVVLRPDVVVVGCNPDETNLEGVHVFELMILRPFILCFRSRRGPDIGDQRRFHVVDRLAIRRLMAVLRNTAITTDLIRMVVPSASRYSLHLSLASITSISVLFCEEFSRVSLTAVSRSAAQRATPPVGPLWREMFGHLY